MKEKKDRRVLRTERQLEEALIGLLKTKNIQQISVRELADAADITRATFYTHYRDAYDMLMHLQDAMIQQIIDMINDTTGKDPHRFFLRLFTYFANEVRHPELLFIATGDGSAFERVGFTIRDNYMLNWTNKDAKHSTRDYEYYRTYMIFGCISVLHLWLENGMKESPETMATLALSFLPQERILAK